jgi:hypothetical protein
MHLKDRKACFQRDLDMARADNHGLPWCHATEYVGLTMPSNGVCGELHRTTELAAQPIDRVMSNRPTDWAPRSGMDVRKLGNLRGLGLDFECFPASAHSRV